MLTKAHRPQTIWNHNVDNVDSQNNTELPHHQPEINQTNVHKLIRPPVTLSLTLPLKILPQKPSQSSGKHELFVLLAWHLQYTLYFPSSHSGVSRLALLSWVRGRKFGNSPGGGKRVFSVPPFECVYRIIS